MAGVAGIVGVVLLMRPWPVADPLLRSAVIDRLAASSGLAVRYAGAMVLRLAPHPAVEIEGLSMTGLGGAVALDADGLEGRLNLLPLLRGNLSVGATTLDRPTITVDLDRVMPLASLIAGGPPAPAPAPAPADRLRFLRTDGLTLRSGVLRLLSSEPRRDTLLCDITATLTWPGALSGAAFGGTATWRGITAAFDIALDAPGRLLTGDGSRASARLRSSALDLSFNGTMGSGEGLHGTGRLSAATQDLPGFLRAIATPAPQLQAFQTASLGGEAQLSADTLSLSNVQLGLDGMTFEGALAVHARAGRPGLAGTLATDRIDLDPFLRALPAIQVAGGAWSEAPLATRAVADDDIDLRISASHASVAGLRFEDGSLSLQSGGGRMELSLGEARAYDGLVKGRVVATADSGTTDVRADLSVSRFDLKKLTKDLFHSAALSGSATGHFSLGGQGGSAAAIIGDLEGRGQVSFRNGRVGTGAADWIGVDPAMAEAGGAPWPSDAASFEAASADFAVARGTASLTAGWILWPEARAAVTGSASAPLQELHLQADLGGFGDDPAVAVRSPVASVTLSGPWRHLRLGPAGGLGRTGGER